MATTTRHYRSFCIAAAVGFLSVSVGLAVLIVAPGIYEHYPQMLREVLPWVPEPFHLMLASMCAAVMTAALSFVLASKTERSTRFRRFLDIGWDRRHRHRYALA